MVVTLQGQGNPLNLAGYVVSANAKTKIYRSRLQGDQFVRFYAKVTTVTQ